MPGKPRECDKGCGEIIAWDETERDGRGGYIEINGNNQFHSKVRCESLGGKWPPMQSQPKSRDSVKQAVNDDLVTATNQKLDRIIQLLEKLTGDRQ